MQPLTNLEKARERNQFGPTAGMHKHSRSGGLDEELKRRRGRYRERAAGTQESETVVSVLHEDCPCKVVPQAEDGWTPGSTARPKRAPVPH